MHKFTQSMLGALALSLAITGVAAAQGVQQTVALLKVDPSTLATGYRTSKIVGSAVINEASETIGKIDDLIVTPEDKVPFAVLSVGGFLGMGERYIVIPFSNLEVNDKRMMLRGATKESLTALPEFHYTK
jgi:hypothetical protein